MPTRIAGSAGNYTAMGQPREGLVTRGLTVEGPVLEDNLERGCRDPLARGNLPDTWGVAVLPPGAWQAWCHIVSAFPRVLLLFQSFLVDILMD
jgi:hypothetical protein